MAQIVEVDANERHTYEALSLQHVRLDSDGLLTVEVPYFANGVAQSVRLRMDYNEALLLAAKITSTIAQKPIYG